MIRFIHISDTHIGPTKDFEIHSINSYSCTEKLIDHLNNLTDTPDFVLHTGDVVATVPDDASFNNARDAFSKLNYPIYPVTGNHDGSAYIKKYIDQGRRISLVDDNSKNAYYFNRGTYRFIILDGKGPKEIDPHGSLSEDQFRAVETQLQQDKMFIISIHFPLFPIGCAWHDSNMLLLEGDRLHALLKEHAHKIIGVFSGHIHRGMQIVKEGVFYSSVASSCVQFVWGRANEHPLVESTGRSYYNVVTIDKGRISIQECSIPNRQEPFVRSPQQG